MHCLDNPFRTLALPVNASRRQIVARLDELRTAARVGVTPHGPADPAWVTTVDRGAASVERARRRLEDTERLARYALEWYWMPRGANRLAEALALLLKGRYRDTMRVCHAELDKELSPDDEIAGRLNLALAARCSVTEQTRRTATAFLGLRRLIVHYDAVCRLADIRGGLPCCEGIDAGSAAAAARSVLSAVFREIERLPASLDTTLIDDALTERAACDHALRRSPCLASIADELPAAPTPHEVRPTHAPAASRTPALRLRRAYEGVLAAARSLFTDLCGYACMLALLYLLFALGVFVDWVLSGCDTPRPSLAAASGMPALAPSADRPGDASVRKLEDDHDQWRMHAEEPEAQLCDTEDNLDDLLGELDADDLDDLLDELETDELEVLFDDDGEEW